MPRTFPIRNEAEWHDYRGRHVGGSEVACLFDQWWHDGRLLTTHVYEDVPEEATFMGGLGFISGHRLFEQKRGRVMPDDLSFNDRVTAGQHLEAGIAAWAGERWPDLKLRKVRRYIAHDDVPGWGASLDYESHQRGMPPVEIKNVDGWVFKQEWAAEGNDIVSAPLRYLLQVQSQIGATGATFGWLIVCVGGNALYRMHVPRHDATQARLAEAVVAFWAGVEAGVFHPAHADYDATAKATAGGDPYGIDLTESGDLPLTVARYERWTRHLKRVTSHTDKLKGRIAMAMGEASKGKHPAFSISWPNVTVAGRHVPAREQAGYSYRGALTITRPKKDSR